MLNVSELSIYFFLDLAATKLKNKSALERARQAIVGIGIDYLSRVYVLHTWVGRIGTTKLVDKSLDLFEQFRPKVFGIEANGMQELMANLVYTEGAKRFGASVPFIPVYQSTKVDKDERIRSGLEPLINKGRLFLQEDQYELKEELRGFPTARTKDLVDALETVCTRVAPRRATAPQKEAEHDQYFKYLRDTGAPSRHIEAEMERLSMLSVN